MATRLVDTFYLVSKVSTNVIYLYMCAGACRQPQNTVADPGGATGAYASPSKNKFLAIFESFLAHYNVSVCVILLRKP